MENTWILYQTTNNVNGKIYVGIHQLQNTNYSKYYLGSGNNIKSAIKKYGRANFTRITLAEFSCAKDAFAAEAKMVTEEFIRLPSNYNLSLGGKGGANLTSEMKVKISNALKGKSYRTDYQVSEETKAKISIANKGRKNTEEHRAKISASNKGKVRTEKHKIKYSESKIGNKHCLGRHHSEESINKIRSSNKCLSVIIEGEFYISAGLAARIKNVCLQTVLDRVRSKKAKFLDWRFATEEEKLTNL
jgi:hypothetical protein